MASPTIAWLPEGIVLACLSVAAATDVRRRIIPNRLVLLVLACGIALRLLSSPSPFWLGFFGPVAVLIALGLLASRDFIGWGDAKLITAVSVAVPPDRLLTLLMAIALAGGVLACLYLAFRTFLRWTAAPAGPVPAVPARSSPLLRLASRERARILAGEPMPYAVAIMSGALFTLATG